MAIETYVIHHQATNSVTYHPKIGKVDEGGFKWIQETVRGENEKIKAMVERVVLPWGELWCNENGHALNQGLNRMASAIAGLHHPGMMLLGPIVLRKIKRCPGEQFEAWREKAIARRKRQNFKVAGHTFAFTKEGWLESPAGRLRKLHYINFEVDGKVDDPFLRLLNEAKLRVLEAAK